MEMRGSALMGVLLLGAAQQQPLTVSGEDLRPGLVAVYRSLAKDGGTLTRIDLKPAFTLGHTSPHPRIAPGPFEAVWTGILQILDDDALTFSGYVGGEAKVTVDGEIVLDARGKNEVDLIVANKAFVRRPVTLAG